MENDRYNPEEDQDILQQLSHPHLQHPIAWKDHKSRNMDQSREAWKKVGGCGLGLNHPKEANIQHHTPSPVLEHTGRESGGARETPGDTE